MPNIRFTKKAVDAIEHPTSGQVLYRDNQLRGFGLRVGAQSKVYFAEGQVRYRSRRVSIGRADVISVDAARKRALSILSDMSAGVVVFCPESGPLFELVPASDMELNYGREIEA